MSTRREGAPPGSEAPAPRVCLITPSFGPERRLFARLGRSVAAWTGPTVEHLVIVARSEIPQFHPLLPPRARVVAIEDLLPEAGLWLLPSWLNPLPSRRQVWITPHAPPVRGWILQQILKIAAASQTRAPILAFADSDSMLVRPLTPESLCAEGRPRLFVERGVCGAFPSHHAWDAVCRRLLGLAPVPYGGDNYVDSLPIWRREVALAMAARLESVAGRPWWQVLARCLRFSEFHLYGLFAEHVMGLEAAGQTADPRKVCLSSWDFDLRDPAEADRFVAALEPHHLGVTVHSRCGIPFARRDALLDRVEARLSAHPVP